MTNWARERGIADEATFNLFVEWIGGKKVSSLILNPTFENADYCFPEQSIIVEHKILETEFGTSDEFKRKQMAVIDKHVRERGLRGPLLGQPYPREFLADLMEFYRRPLAGVAKKANRQIKETKDWLGMPNANGIFLCVNDNLKSLPPAEIMQLFCRILNGSCSSIEALVYVTNHYLHVPGSNLANLLWAPVYSDGAPDSLVEFVNWMGRK